MRNRPGRIFYMIDFKGLSMEFVMEYCEDNLENKLHIPKICNIASLFAQFNFDMLKALVEEMNRYDETPEEALAILNVKPEFDEGNKFDVKLAVPGQKVNMEKMDDRTWKGNPLHQKVRIEYVHTQKDQDGDEYDDWETQDFTHTDLLKIDPNSGQFHFKNKAGATLTLSRVKEKSFHYYDAF